MVKAQAKPTSYSIEVAELRVQHFHRAAGGPVVVPLIWRQSYACEDLATILKKLIGYVRADGLIGEANRRNVYRLRVRNGDGSDYLLYDEGK